MKLNVILFNDIYKYNLFNSTALNVSVQMGNLEIAQILCENQKVDVNAKSILKSYNLISFKYFNLLMTFQITFFNYNSIWNTFFEYDYKIIIFNKIKQ